VFLIYQNEKEIKQLFCEYNKECANNDFEIKFQIEQFSGWKSFGIDYERGSKPWIRGECLFLGSDLGIADGAYAVSFWFQAISKYVSEAKKRKMIEDRAKKVNAPTKKIAKSLKKVSTLDIANIASKLEKLIL